MTYTLTPDQLIDILLQKPGRITEGALEQRLAYQRLKDHVLSYKRTEMVSYGGGFKGDFQKATKKHMYVFDYAAEVPEEHPRSLKKAVFELNMLGYSKSQINDISEDVRRFALGYIYTDGAASRFARAIMNDLGNGFGFFWNADSFLGTGVFIPREEVKSSGLMGAVPSLKDGDVILNSAYSDKTLPEAETLFRECFHGKISRNPHYLTPAYQARVEGLSLTA